MISIVKSFLYLQFQVVLWYVRCHKEKNWNIYACIWWPCLCPLFDMLRSATSMCHNEHTTPRIRSGPLNLQIFQIPRLRGQNGNGLIWCIWMMSNFYVMVFNYFESYFPSHHMSHTWLWKTGFLLLIIYVHICLYRQYISYYCLIHLWDLTYEKLIEPNLAYIFG